MLAEHSEMRTWRYSKAGEAGNNKATQLGAFCSRFTDSMAHFASPFLSSLSLTLFLLMFSSQANSICIQHQHTLALSYPFPAPSELVFASCSSSNQSHKQTNKQTNGRTPSERVGPNNNKICSLV